MGSNADTVDSATPLLVGATAPLGRQPNNGGISSNNKTKAGANLKPFNRWVPFAPRYWRFHLGTDMLMASWLFVLASAMWVGIESDTIATEGVTSFPEAFNDGCTLTCAVLFLIGSVYFVYLSYPEEMERQMAELAELAQDPSKINDMSFTERYFTGRCTSISYHSLRACTERAFQICRCCCDASCNSSRYTAYQPSTSFHLFLPFPVICLWPLGSLPFQHCPSWCTEYTPSRLSPRATSDTCTCWRLSSLSLASACGLLQVRQQRFCLSVSALLLRTFAVSALVIHSSCMFFSTH